jgi:ABC-type proline/glycine betaine transport system ATPase subunit
LTKEAANLAAKELGLVANQADDYVKLWTAPENKAKLDAAEAIVFKQEQISKAIEKGKKVFAESTERRTKAEAEKIANLEDFEAQKIGKSEAKALKEQLAKWKMQDWQRQKLLLPISKRFPKKSLLNNVRE